MPDMSSEKYVRLTTFTRDARPKHTPVWIAAIDGAALGFITDAESWKVKRIRTTAAIELIASDGRGRVNDEAAGVAGSAHIVDPADPTYAQIESALTTKYGLMFRMFRFMARVRGKDQCGVVIALG